MICADVSRSVWLSIGGIALFVAGCGDVSLEFSTLPETETLISPAQSAVDDLLQSSYGTPERSVTWEKLPIEFHAARAEATVVDETTPTQLELDVDYQTASIEPGQKVVWVSGENVAAVRTVAEWNEEDGLLTVDSPLPVEVDAEMIAIAPGAHLKHGRRVYAQHCQHCHGVGGDGNGPTAWSMTPKPRDFRLGEFKFTSTLAGRKVTRADLTRTLDHGIPGTYMPSFKLLPKDDTRAVVEYVRWLSIRGEMENELVKTLALDYGQDVAADYDDPAELDEEFLEYAEEDLAYDFEDSASFTVGKWDAAERPNAIVTPKLSRTPPTAESIARGRQIYLSDTAKCVSCHGETGAGNGPGTLDFQNSGDGFYPVRGYHDSWGQPIQPRNLLLGNFRGGRRPIDVYRRIHAGVKGGPMPAFGTNLSEEQIWDIVNYVLALPEDPLAGQEKSSPTTTQDQTIAVTK